MSYPTKNSEWIGHWIDRMTHQFGGSVWGNDGRCHDWGQGLCLTQYGEFRADDGSVAWPDDPSQADIDRAISWEVGHWPGWVNRKRTRRKLPRQQGAKE